MTKMNLHQKIVQIRKEVSYLQTDKDGYKYKYVTEAAILERLRPKMDELNVVLEFEMPSVTIDTSAGKPLLKATQIFVLIDADNPQDRIEKTMVLYEGGELDAKKCGALTTYGMKYFLFKYFNVGRGDDPDDVQDVPISKEQAKELEWLFKYNPKIREALFSQYRIESTNEIPDRLFHQIFYWASKPVLKQLAEKKSEVAES